MKKKLFLNNAQVRAELGRCLNCATKPCHKVCPAGCNPNEFINLALAGKWEEAAFSILRANPLGQVCGLICPDKFCMKSCARATVDFSVNIPKVQAAILQKARNNPEFRLRNAEKLNGMHVAVVGAGPAGIAAAAVLAGRGYSVTLFEADRRIGGAMNMIPEERLPHEVIEADWDFIKNIGDIDLRLKTPVENLLSLFEGGYVGVIAAVGEPNCVGMGIAGEEFCLNYMDYLKTPERYAREGNVAIIGGGAVAADCAFTARKNGAQHVEMFVRRRFSDMKISGGEREMLLDCEIDMTTMTRVCAVTKNDNGLIVETVKTRFNKDGRLEDIPDTRIKRPDFKYVVMAIGSRANEHISHDKIIYAGDCVSGSSTVVEAIASGKNAGDRLDALLSGKKTEENNICLKVG